MRLFKINEKINILAEYKKTRNGFKHEATLLLNGVEVDETKICYLNRTWEKFEYQSVVLRLIEKTNELNEEEKVLSKKFMEGDLTDWSQFKTTNLIAGLSEVFCDTKKEKNDWKTRMFKAGLSGLSFPEDWESLSEDEKEKRLSLIEKQIQNI